jgi:sugar lactone lactonase YvrE
MSAPEILMSGIAMGESPRWHDGRLWFCDWVAHEVIAVDLAGRSEVIANVHSLPFSIDWLRGGSMLVTSGKQLLRMDEDSVLVTHCDLSGLAAHALNEIVVDGRGNTYVNGAGFDMMAGGEFAPGIVARVTPDRRVEEVASGIAFPNGMAVTPDNATLIVADSYGNELTAFDIATDGTLANRRTWADLGDHNPDGICIDSEGAVWYADVPHACCVRVAEGGERLQAIEVDRGCFACMLGGPARSTLFIVAQEWRGPAAIGSGPRTGQVLAVDAPAPHAGWP